MSPEKVELYSRFSIIGVVLYTFIVAMLVFTYIDYKKAKEQRDDALRKKSILKFIIGPLLMIVYFIVMLVVFL